jgi:hypothetical protein
MEQLPTELIEPIFSQVAIDDLLSLRLVCQSFRVIIDSRINTLAPQIARNTFPKARLLLRPPPDFKYDLKWLKGLIPKRLASIIVDRHRKEHLEFGLVLGIPAEEVFGDELRAKVENGWRVYKRLSKISRAVYALPESEIPPIESELDLGIDPQTRRINDYKNIRLNATGPATTHELLLELKTRPGTCKNNSTGGETTSAFFSRMFHRFCRKLHSRALHSPTPFLSGAPNEIHNPKLIDIERREHLVWKRSTQFIGKLSDDDSSDYGLLHSFFHWVFASETHLDPPLCVYGQDARFVIFAFDFVWDVDRFSNSSATNLVHANSWVNWYLLHEGPDLFWKQWNCESSGLKSQNQHYIRDALRHAWAERSETQVAIERKYGVFINNTMRVQASWRHGRYWEGRTIACSYRGYSSDSTMTYYQRYLHEDANVVGKSMIVWHAWMKGLNVDDNFNAWEYDEAESLPDLHDKCFDSLEGVAYSVYL